MDYHRSSAIFMYSSHSLPLQVLTPIKFESISNPSISRHRSFIKNNRICADVIHTNCFHFRKGQRITLDSLSYLCMYQRKQYSIEISGLIPVKAFDNSPESVVSGTFYLSIMGGYLLTTCLPSDREKQPTGVSWRDAFLSLLYSLPSAAPFHRPPMVRPKYPLCAQHMLGFWRAGC